MILRAGSSGEEEEEEEEEAETILLEGWKRLSKGCCYF